jgi:hypothetical protein
MCRSPEPGFRGLIHSVGLFFAVHAAFIDRFSAAAERSPNRTLAKIRAKAPNIGRLRHAHGTAAGGTKINNQEEV